MILLLKSLMFSEEIESILTGEEDKKVGRGWSISKELVVNRQDDGVAVNTHRGILIGAIDDGASHREVG